LVVDEFPLTQQIAWAIYRTSFMLVGMNALCHNGKMD